MPTFAEHTMLRRCALSSFWTIQELVYGAFGPKITNPMKHEMDAHFKKMAASYPNALQDAVKALERLRLCEFTRLPYNFEELYDLVANNIGKIRGVGPVAIYDIALRIGCNLRPKIIPEKFVYTHGSQAKVEKSALILVGKSKIVKNRVDVSEFKTIIPHYSAMEIEDILCVYHNKILQYRRFDISWLNSI